MNIDKEEFDDEFTIKLQVPWLCPPIWYVDRTKRI